MTTTPARTTSRGLSTLFHFGTLGGLTDGQLLERFAARRDEGGDLAFAALVERHGPMVLRVCRGVLRDDHEAMDAFQVTFLVLARKGGSLWVRDSVGPWLHRVACRAATRARAGAARRRKLELRVAEAVGGEGDDDREDRAALLHEELDRLPDRYRVPIVLCDLEGCTCEEAAQQLRRSVRTVKSWRARGRQRLKDRLARRGLSGFPSSPIPCLTSPSAMLPSSTIDAVTRIATARGMAGVAPATVLSLTEGVLRSMLTAKLKVVAAAVLAVGVIASSVGVFAYQTPTSEPARPETKGRTSTDDPEGVATKLTETISRPYYIGDLIMPGRRVPVGAPGDRMADLPKVDVSPIMELIASSVAPGTWKGFDARGKVLRPGENGPEAVGSMTPFYLSLSLIIRHTVEVHDQIGDRLRLLRRIRYLDQSPELQEAPAREGGLPEIQAIPDEAKAVERRQKTLESRSERIRRLVKELDREIEAFTRESPKSRSGQ